MGSEPSVLEVLFTLAFAIGSSIGLVAASIFGVRLLMDRVHPDPHKLASMEEKEPGPFVSHLPGDPRARLPHKTLTEIEFRRARNLRSGASMDN